jgi:homogentisate 1,2-dioxygenase
MPFYQRRGRIPAKRHIVFRNPEGGLYYEELIGNEGFTGASSLLYRIGRPTRVVEAGVERKIEWKAHGDPTLRPHHLRLGRVERGGDPCLDRTPFAFNEDVALAVARPAENGPGFYRNGRADEIVYVARGSGTLDSALGELGFGAGDYLVIPRGLVHGYRLDEEDPLFLIAESRGVVRIPPRYRNANGQLLEGAPYSERDIRTPENLRAREETGEFPIFTKRGDTITRHVVQSHPFDVVGWDGTYYPWAFNIRDFEPIVGKVHQPPPVHQTFAGDGFVVCSFVPRLYDFHPEAIPTPYHHSNAQSEEILFYAADEFMSRKGIEFGSVTYHPDGMPHGPHPGTIEKGIGAEKTDELAVMVDTFRPLSIAAAAMPYDDPDYVRSWLE